jgi:GPH family glycoside/pentoside/hexuronide:cation symporter
MDSEPEKSASPTGKVSVGQKLAFGIGVIPHEFVVTGIKYLGNPIFNITLHLSNTLIGWVYIIIRIVDAFTDPIIGNLSDNTRSKWGRRKPFILFGAFGSAIVFTFIWWVPKSLYGTAWPLFWYFLILALIHYGFVTCFQVPYNALGYELSSDYHDRTRVFAYRAFFAGIAKLILPWLFWLTLRPIFGGDAMVGVKWVGGAAGIVIILFILPTLLKVKEGSAKKAKTQEKVDILKAIGLTFKNRPFRILVFLTFVTIFGSNFGLALGYYVNIYYVFDGVKEDGAFLVGVGNTVGAIVSFASIPLLTIMSTKIGKIKMLGFCITMLGIGSILSWWCYTPDNPYLQLVTYPFMVMGDMGFWLFVTSMKADICDWDEWKTGLRREGITFGGASFVLTWIAFDAALGGDQSESTILWLRGIYAGLPAILAILGVIALKFYPLDYKKFKEIQSDMEARMTRLVPEP